MANAFGSQDVKCPFYRKHKGECIYCERLIRSGVGNVCTRFRSREALQQWMRGHCCRMDYGEKCAIASALEKYYRGE